MNEQQQQQQADELSRSLDAMLRGQEAGAADPEIQALTALGRTLRDLPLQPGPVHRAAVERLVRDHRPQIREAIGHHKETTMTTQPQTHSDLPARRAWPRWLVPAAALSGALVLLFVCAIVALLGGGMAWRTLRQTEPTALVAVQTPAAPRSSAPGAGAAVTPAAAETEQPEHTVYLPLTTHPLDPQEALLDQAQGVVEVQDAAGVWSAASAPLMLAAGQRVRTGEMSSARVLFYDGSAARLGPASEVSLDELGQDPTDQSRIVRLTQWSGDTDHDVAPAPAANGRYEVNTPSGTGVAKGTSFHVTITPALVVRFIVDEGAVAVTHLQVTVIVVAGQVTTIPVDRPPTTPVFRITGQGEVTQTGTVWEIAGQSFTTHDSTVIVGNPQVGDWVHVDGHLEGGTRFADRIVLVRRSPADRFTISGEIEAMAAITWTVAGLDIAVDEETELPAGAEVGDLVVVEGTVEAGGVMRAESIRLLLPEPELTFTFAGVVQAIHDEYWLISGISITVDAETSIGAGIDVSDTVRVHGLIMEDGTRLARSIVRLARPAGRFEFAGRVESIDPWIVSGLAIETRDWTEIKGPIALGDRVRVEGQILTDGTWVADEIKLLDDEDRGKLRFKFVGRVESMDPWVISGVEIEVDGDTKIKGPIAIGMVVRVDGRILADGTWLAREIKPLFHPTQGRGCVQVTAHVVGISGHQIRLRDGTLVDLNGTIPVEGELLNGSVISISVCIDPSGGRSIVSIVVIYQLGPIETPGPHVPDHDDDDDDDDGDDDDDDDDDDRERGDVTICHMPGTPAEQTKSVTRSALPGHLAHGDTIGACK